jgi:pyridoxamine 5'-phosphate oxidase
LAKSKVRLPLGGFLRWNSTLINAVCLAGKEGNLKMFAEIEHRQYHRSRLDEENLPGEPLQLFDAWLQAAQAEGINDWQAMSIASVDAAGRPSQRVVYLRHWDERGLVFFTNYHSRKGREIAENADISALFFWSDLERQVRIEGRASKTTSDESDAYFAGRGRDSQIGAWASAQSESIANRHALEQSVAEVQRRFGEEAIPRPPHWGGYRLLPQQFEFWQGRPHRLHDRFVYLRRDNDAWQRRRLAP